MIDKCPKTLLYSRFKRATQFWRICIDSWLYVKKKKMDYKQTGSILIANTVEVSLVITRIFLFLNFSETKKFSAESFLTSRELQYLVSYFLINRFLIKKYVYILL